jgi:hypothetical protein
MDNFEFFVTKLICFAEESDICSSFGVCVCVCVCVWEAF